MMSETARDGVGLYKNRPVRITFAVRDTGFSSFLPHNAGRAGVVLGRVGSLVLVRFFNGAMDWGEAHHLWMI